MHDRKSPGKTTTDIVVETGTRKDKVQLMELPGSSNYMKEKLRNQVPEFVKHMEKLDNPSITISTQCNPPVCLQIEGCISMVSSE